ncbi:protein FAR1-RELATED SEQUENCE 5-like [Spinacia oleracea]|uniref:Protein FAR1-RELATED SEQUENCE 5-like n=1 Tax=Spinacia oleracea TaxID=3562 RepID=A0ABM3QXB8_SPIOL|nr:protein FAR1-RELATED SEQUENCE 5-like [Spinacia oleracea]
MLLVSSFCVRKAKQVRKVGTTQVTTKLFLCSAVGKRNIVLKKDQKQEKDELEGLLTEENTSVKKQKRKPRRVAITMTGCNALIKAKLNDGGQFEIIQHVMAHNHPLTRQQWNHLHRSEREMTVPKEKAIEAMHESGFRPSESFRYMSNEAGGEDDVGHSYKDHMNFCYKLKIKAIEGGDSQVVYDKLQDAYYEDPNFFFRIRLDKDGRVCNFFWRDSMMLEDYKIYGDVTVFDTTYRTNRYNLICAPFVGINNHWKNTIFACALLGDEKTESFVWLFETFKKAMGDKSPITLFIDQDGAMARAIKKSHTIEEARKILEDSFKKDSEAIQTIFTATSNNEQNTTNTTTENENSVQVLDPAHANTKGKSKKRIPGSYDNFNKGKRRKHREFGSKTPKHLF